MKRRNLLEKRMLKVLVLGIIFGLLVFFFLFLLGQQRVQILLVEGSVFSEGLLRFVYVLIPALSGILVCAGFISFEMNRIVTYIHTLQKEVSNISSGDLNQYITREGRDELTALAEDLDLMRRTLLENQEKEKERKAATDKIVMGMSHDLRTPLTGLMTYVDVMERQLKEGKIQEEYLLRCQDKLLQIRNLSDEMFEYFLVTANEKVQMEDAESEQSAVGDYLSELCSFLKAGGYKLQTEISFGTGRIRVSEDYMGRIFNNLISNLDSYADLLNPVMVSAKEEKGQFHFSIRNTKAKDPKKKKSTGIGVTNMELMMEQMGGKLEVASDDSDYEITFFFPLSDEHSV